MKFSFFYCSCFNLFFLKVCSYFSVFKCSECFKVFSSERVLLEHQASKHRSERQRYQCSQCSYSTPKSFNLKQHLLVHTGEKPHKCHICQKSFQQKSGLKVHLRLHYGEMLFYFFPYLILLVNSYQVFCNK